MAMSWNKFVKTSEDAKKALIGTIIADGYVEKQRTPNGRAMIEICHTSRNLDYLRLKKELFEIIPGIKCEIVPHNKVTKEKTYELYRLMTNKNDWATELRDAMYIEKDGIRKKLLRKQDINYLSEFGLFLLYLDDGSFHIRYYEGKDKIRSLRVRFHLDCFRLDELDYFQKWLLKEYDLKTGIEKKGNGYNINMNTENTKKFMNIIDKYYNLIPSMNYKFIRYYNLS